jgi:hypothetical protein
MTSRRPKRSIKKRRGLSLRIKRVKDQYPKLLQNGEFVPGHCKGDGKRGEWMWGTALGGGGVDAINDKWAGDTQSSTQSSDFPQCHYPGNRPLLISPQNKRSVQLPPVPFSCMCVCVYTYWYIYTHRYMCMCAYTYENVYTCIYIHKYTHMCTCPYIYMYIYIYIYIHTHTYTYVHTYIRIYLPISIYKYICRQAYKHTHTSTPTHTGEEETAFEDVLCSQVATGG